MGELFAGYGGLGMGVAEVLDVELAWVSEIDKGPSKILEHRFPDVPNLGDITKIDWADVEPVDVLTGGFPCQDVSAAGKRAGIRPGTRSGLWAQFAYAIDQLRPSLVVIENVRGLLSARAHSDVEPCPWCVGDDPDGALRACGAVLGDLADLGFDADWIGVPASRVGAPHGRWREFFAAYPRGIRRPAGWPTVSREAHGGRPSPDAAGCGDASVKVLPTPTTRDWKDGGPNENVPVNALLGRAIWALLPTPRAGDGEKGGPNQRGSSGDLMLPSAVTHLLPTPTSMDSRASGGNPDTTGTHGTTLTDATARRPQDWGQYAAAIHHWEQLTRPAPAPTELSAKGTPRLSARFSEWMMGLPDGWVTDVLGITRNEALKALGNGVVPQQAAAGSAAAARAGGRRMTILHDSPRVLTRGECRIDGCERPVKVLARQLCAGCYNRELRNGRLEPIEGNALTGGRWVNVRGVMRWAADEPASPDLWTTCAEVPQVARRPVEKSVRFPRRPQEVRVA